jgi:site-specific DNA-methyltransferase (adenine-specific)
MVGKEGSMNCILYIWKDEPQFNRDAVRVPYSESFLKNSAGKKAHWEQNCQIRSSAETIYTAHESGALPRDVFTDISTLAGGAGKERYFLLHR